MQPQTLLRFTPTIRALAKATAVGLISAALLVPASAQFWNPFSSAFPRQQQRAPQFQQQPQYNPFNSLFGGSEPRRQQQKADNTQAPTPARRTPESTAAITSPILVLGDSMADWLGYGLEEALAERPEFGVVRRARSLSGLVRYDPRRDVEWAQIVRETIAADKPKFIVMMVGFHDRQPIRERSATPPPARAPAGQPAPPTDDPERHEPDSPESRARASADAQNAEMHDAQPSGSPDPRAAAPSGPMEFQSEAWQAAYIRRIDATIAALKSANVPVLWVGLPPQRVARQSADAVYLNELYRTRAERAGIVYVDIWDGFVDEAGRYSLQGPDFEGQIRRLRSSDGVYFTPAGARKLAHYVEREILRTMVSRQTPLALPTPEPTQPGRPGSSRPLAGPVIPLTASIGGGNELLGGGPARPSGIDPLATRVLTRGEPVTAPSGRADNFTWPRGGSATIPENEPEELQAPPQQQATPAPQAAPQAPPRPATRTTTIQPPPQPAPGARTIPVPPQQPQTAPNGRTTIQVPQQNPAQPAPSAARPKAQVPQQQQPQSADPKQPAQRKAPPQQQPRASNDSVPRPPLPIAR